MKAVKKTRPFYVFAFVARLLVFLATVFYAVTTSLPQFLSDLESVPTRLSPVAFLWAALMTCMIFRLFPSRIESIGCQKIYVNRYVPTDAAPTPEDIRTAKHSARSSLIFWVLLNSLFFIAYYVDLIDARFMVCLSAFYSVVDIFCILFFCPFQSWFMHNRCCTTCRIFDWDYLMICTPLLAIPNLATLSLGLVAFIIFFRWELTFARHKERFIETSNCALKCSQCDEQLCHYKRAIAAKTKKAFAAKR